MFLRSITAKGVTRLYYYESFYEDGKTKQRCVESLGRLDDLRQIYDDPVEHFRKEAERLTKEKTEKRFTTITIDNDEKLPVGETNLKNVGYGVLKEIYKELQLDKFWKAKAAKSHIKYDLEKIFQLLVISRILFPGSKKDSFENKDQFFEAFAGFELEDVYKALDLFDRYNEDLQQWIYDHSVSLCDRDVSVSYFDCTNYYFDIGAPDHSLLDPDGNPIDLNGKPTQSTFRKRGPEKNHRPDPIVEMGLLIDKNGIPLAFDIFPGNESEKVHMLPIIKRAKKAFNTKRIIVVADRGLNTSDNIYYLNGKNTVDDNSLDGYVYGQSVRGASDSFKQWVLSGDYIRDESIDQDGNRIVFIHKSRIERRKLKVSQTDPTTDITKKKSVTIDQKQMAYYSQKYADKQKLERSIMIARAKDLIENPRKYTRVTAAGSASYIKNISFNKNTGEIIDGKLLSLDLEKIAEEEKYDGYYSIVTSELAMSDAQMRDVYGGLIKIEETFKISKSDFESRPVYVRTDAHIEGHFVTCFSALVIIRLLQAKLTANYPVGRILESLRRYCCTRIDNSTYQFIYYDEIIKACSEFINKDLNNKYLTQEQIRRILRY